MKTCTKSRRGSSLIPYDLMPRLKRDMQEDEAASSFFRSTLYLHIRNNGISLKEIEKFIAFPRIIANPGISLESLAGLLDVPLQVRDLIMYNTGMGIKMLEEDGLVEMNDNRVSPTEKGIRLFRFLCDREAVDTWLSREASKARSEGVEMVQFANNASKARAIISNMSRTYEDGAKGVARQS